MLVVPGEASDVGVPRGAPGLQRADGALQGRRGVAPLRAATDPLLAGKPPQVGQAEDGAGALKRTEEILPGWKINIIFFNI